MMTDADVFLDILDLASERRVEWFGDSIDAHLLEATAHVLAGKTQPILQRLGDSSRSDLDLASLIYFFPISVYEGYLSRNQCLEILRGIWESSLRTDQEEHTSYRAATFDAFCLLSISEDDPIMQQAEGEGIGNLFMAAEVAATCRTIVPALGWASCGHPITRGGLRRRLGNRSGHPRRMGAGIAETLDELRYEDRRNS